MDEGGMSESEIEGIRINIEVSGRMFEKEMQLSKDDYRLYAGEEVIADWKHSNHPRSYEIMEHLLKNIPNKSN